MLYAQDTVISSIIFSEDSQLALCVFVMVKGTDTDVVSDFDRKIGYKILENGCNHFFLVGLYIAKEIVVDGRTIIDLVLRAVRFHVKKSKFAKGY